MIERWLTGRLFVTVSSLGLGFGWLLLLRAEGLAASTELRLTFKQQQPLQQDKTDVRLVMAIMKAVSV